MTHESVCGQRDITRIEKKSHIRRKSVSNNDEHCQCCSVKLVEMIQNGKGSYSMDGTSVHRMARISMGKLTPRGTPKSKKAFFRLD